MTTLEKKADEIAALEKIKTEIKEWNTKLEAEKRDKVREAIVKKIQSLKQSLKEIKETGKDISAKQLANALLASRKKFLEMTKKDFNGVVRQLAKKPEYYFLKGMTRAEIKDDIMRKAKPVGWRFKGRGDYRTPSTAQVRKGRSNGSVYYENRPNRSDVSQSKQLEKGGGVKGENLPFCIYVSNLNNPNENSELVAKVKAKGDAFLITSMLNKSLHRDTPLVYTMKEKKYEDGGNLEAMDEDDMPVIRYYFEDDAFEYEDGGDIDINDLNIPIHYTMFEDEMFEYGKGGGVERNRKINAALDRKYANWEYPVPPVSTARWTLKDWSNWIEKHGRKK